MNPHQRMLCAILFMTITGVAIAQIEPDPDVLGIYFDLNGTVYERYTAAPFQIVTAYALVTRPSDPIGISGWEAGVIVDGPAVVPHWSLAAGMDVDLTDTGFQVVIGTGAECLPSAQAVLLATWTGFVMSPTDQILFTVTALPGSGSFGGRPGYTSGSDPSIQIPLESSSGYPFTYCAGINSSFIEPGPTYRMLVEITASNGLQTDYNNMLGFNDWSVDGLGSEDDPAEPRPDSDYLRLTFPHPEWDDPAGPDYDIDLRDYYWYFTSAKTWNFRVETDHTDLPVTLVFHSLYIYGNPDNQRLVNLASGEQVVFDAYEEIYEFMPEPSGVNFFEFTAGLPDGPTGVDPVAASPDLTARPNPFNPQTELFFTSPQAGTAAIRIHDVLGRLVTTLQAGDLPAGGRGRVTWRGRDDAGREVASGTYFASLTVDGRGVGEIRKLSLVR